ncbi:outer membrane protein assembly factor BamE [Afifella marina]|uniref:Outer membrane protein assembly factor BamE, lipoprotein component of the BamABCDE complex n=1 Tax=Afifella marina DSM 2698 TaxID=1120955 RepID=A0A1G5NKD2_AFIMA|nr:outer membrane protein assembly factor BamE [Afifella marina]MBK1623578.1 outer membrane protein assembly factor BamE [Afifella marina DSM 2698]MBK1626571.1 outer membrane protein assembly factor BamE [Afifella marina]MBK5916120.1 cell envelope protein SmpA [Afifella marina]RAI21677.1 cell envelope protein SmpA [Afifella marina DSM 2698]SCZ37209.1 Outer membrane protein assembly factor BamE, lipoprotein component of the BamABCDE complex [Afifella marina DSM 2698]
MTKKSHVLALLVSVAAAGALGGCIGQTQHRGYIANELALEQIPEGSSRDQVLIVLGTPSTTADFGGEVFYYISQTASRPVAFLNPHIVDQRVLAVYFDKDQTVTRVANYGLKDGKVFDFVSRTTPTAGKDFSFVSQLLSAAGRVAF